MKKYVVVFKINGDILRTCGHVHRTIDSAYECLLKQREHNGSIINVFTNKLSEQEETDLFSLMFNDDFKHNNKKFDYLLDTVKTQIRDMLQVEAYRYLSNVISVLSVLREDKEPKIKQMELKVL